MLGRLQEALGPERSHDKLSMDVAQCMLARQFNGSLVILQPP